MMVPRTTWSGTPSAGCGVPVHRVSLTQTSHEEPLRERRALGRFDSEVYGEAQERIRKAVVRGRLGRDDIAELGRDVFHRELAACGAVSRVEQVRMYTEVTHQR